MLRKIEGRFRVAAASIMHPAASKPSLAVGKKTRVARKPITIVYPLVRLAKDPVATFICFCHLVTLAAIFCGRGACFLGRS